MIYMTSREDKGFENKVCDMVERKLGKLFDCERENGRQRHPDIITIEKNHEEPLKLAFDATRIKKLWVDRVSSGKIKQMTRYLKSEPAFLVVPTRLLGVPFRLYKGVYTMPIDWLPKFLEFILKNIDRIRRQYNDIETPFEYDKIFADFLPTVYSEIGKCKYCNSPLITISLTYCSKSDQYLYPEFFDMSETDDNKPLTRTYSECDACVGKDKFLLDLYDEGKLAVQCTNCGAVFDNLKVIKNFEDSHLSLMEECFDFYRKSR